MERPVVPEYTTMWEWGNLVHKYCMELQEYASFLENELRKSNGVIYDLVNDERG